VDDVFERLLFAAEILRALRVFPDFRILERAIDLVQPVRLGIEVKDTSAARRRARAGRRGSRG
jgi:hypothetical protein